MSSLFDHSFTYHTPKPSDIHKYEAIQSKAKEFAHLIAELAPKGREQSLSLTKLEEVVFWANASIARFWPPYGSMTKDSNSDV